MMRLKRFSIPGAALAAALCLAPAAPAQTTVSDLETRFPECAGMFTEEDIEALRQTAEDPEETFQRWRRQRLSMAEESPRMVCRSRVWRHLHGVASAREEGKRLSREDDPLVAIFAASASVGANQTPANGVSDYQGETFIAVNPKNPLQLVAGANSFFRDPAPGCQAPAGASKTFGTQALYGSTDGGKTWTYRCAPWHPAVVGGVPGADGFFGSDPALAWDANGNAYVAYMLISQDDATAVAGSAIVVAKSADAGGSWTPLGVVANNITTKENFNDKEMIAVDTSSGGDFSHPGRIYVIWDQDNDAKVAFSDDGANWTTRTFSAPGYHKGGNLAVGDDGTVYAVWNRAYVADSTGQATPDKTWFSKSVTGGDTWSTPVQILDHNLASFQTAYRPAAQNERGINSFVSIDVNRNPSSPFYNRLHLAWADVTLTCCPLDTASQIDVYSTYSTDGGSSWAAPILVNDDSGEGKTHMFPWLAVDQSDGTVSVVWYDTRNDPFEQTKTQIYYARSANGGAGFEENFSLMDEGAKFKNPINYCQENSLENPKRNPNQYGDYLGIAAANRKVHAFWTDTRQYFPVFSSLREDAATTAVTHCSPPFWLQVYSTPTVPASAFQNIQVSWPTVTGWGVNATGGTYMLLRYTGAGCTGRPFGINVPAGATSVLDSPDAPGTYSYRVRPRNNCPGTALTPMTALSACSSAVQFSKYIAFP
ncbi:MAG TPA: sialidase family protein [Thermoanaerobaculia bacterium]|nr:sialidase family protein [Thermoanaerobaculia bacterium]